MDIKQKPIAHQVTHDKYEVFHLQLHDESSDLHLLAHNENDSKQLLIPVYKKVLISNLEYFASMFRESSNFIESTETDSKGTIPILKIQVENPHQFAKYLSTFYGNKLHLTDENCLDIYKLVDFFSDDDTIKKVSEFINGNKLSVDSIIQFTGYTDKFDKVVNYYIERNLLNVNQFYNLSHTSNRFKEISDKYFKECVESSSSFNMADLILNCNYNSSYIDISMKNNKAIIRNITKQNIDDINGGHIIFTNTGIKSFRITCISTTREQCEYIYTGWTNSPTRKIEKTGLDGINTIFHDNEEGSCYIYNTDEEQNQLSEELLDVLKPTPIITWGVQPGQNNYIVIKKEDNYELSWKQGDKINKIDCWRCGFGNTKNLYPIIDIWEKSTSTFEISDVEIE